MIAQAVEAESYQIAAVVAVLAGGFFSALICTNRLKNAEGALADAGTFCDGIGDVTNGIDRLGAEIERLRDVQKEIARLDDAEITKWRGLADQLAEALDFVQDDIETDFGHTLTDDALAAYEAAHKESA